MTTVISAPEPLRGACRPASTVTDVAVDALRASEANCEADVLGDAIDAVLTRFEAGGLVDSHRLADELVSRRVRRRCGSETVETTQTKDYTQHLLRNAAGVCGHAVDGSWYRIHRPAECGPACKARRDQAPATVDGREVCGGCFIAKPLTGVCDTCG